MPLTLSFFSAGLDFGAILVKPSSSSSEGQFPLVVFIHGLWTLSARLPTQEGTRVLIFCPFVLAGGPHSQFPAEWNSTTAGLVQLGFAVLMGQSISLHWFSASWFEDVFCSLPFPFCLCLVNYRGSTGFGQDSILSLIGQIGSQDVKDVQVPVVILLYLFIHHHSLWLMALSAEGGARCSANRRHPGLQTCSCHRRFSRGLPFLSPGRPVPRLLQGVCGQEPRH